MKTYTNRIIITISIIALSLVACDSKEKPSDDNLNLEMTTTNSKLQEIPTDIENELQEDQIIVDNVRKLFEEENFTELDKIALQYRDTNQRTPSGLWKLSTFYGSFYFDIYNKDESYWQGNFEIMDKWIEHTNSPTAHILKARLIRQYAWKYRGGSYVNKVPQDAWKPFKENLYIANKYLDDYKDIASVSPEWYVEKIEVLTGLGEDTDKLTQIFDEGVAKFPGYYQIYFQAIRYLSPKWHGNARQIENFANHAVSLTEKDEGMGMYARIYWVASQHQYEEKLFYQSNVVWKKMKQGIFDVLDKYPDQWNIQNFAYFSCLANDKKTTRKLMKQVQKPIIMEAWKNENVYNKCKNL